jgi:hypothetical protein
MPGMHWTFLIDEMADVHGMVDVELDQQVVIPRRRIDFRGDFGLRQRIGDGIGLAHLAFDLDEEGDHRCFSRKVRFARIEPKSAGHGKHLRSGALAAPGRARYEG